MSSTRNLNTCGNYRLQQDAFNLASTYTSYECAANGRAYTPAIPCMGIMPSHMPRNTLSHNPVEIETALFGINSTNLVEPQPAVVPDLKHVPEVSYFERLPLLMPDSLVVEKNQRPFPVPQ
jgi:hypothetical protein